MNQELTDFFNRYLEESVQMLGQTFVYKNKTYTGVITPIETSTEATGDGLLDYTIDTKLTVLKSGFNQSPKAGEIIFVEEKKLRITKVNESEINFELTCISANK